MNKLKRLNFKVSKCVKLEDNIYLLVVPPTMSLLVNEKKKKLIINFNVDVKPEDSALMTLILKDIKDTKDLRIGDSFYVNHMNKYFEGDDAYTEFEKYKSKKIVNDFMREKMEENILIDFCIEV